MTAIASFYSPKTPMAMPLMAMATRAIAREKAKRTSMQQQTLLACFSFLIILASAQ